MAKPAKPKPSPTTSTSRGPRPVPAPWLDCGHCGWRHYPDSHVRHGERRLAAVCDRCGETLPDPEAR